MNAPRTLTDEDLTKFLALCQSMNPPRPDSVFGVVFDYTKGPKYVRIVRKDTHKGVVQPHGSVHCFLDYQGNIYKSASWKAPAKHIRGNIFREDGGKSGMGQYGARYL